VSQVDLKRMEEGYGFIDLPHSFRGVQTRPGVKRFLVEIRPRRWKKTIWLGTHEFPPLPPHLNLLIKEQALKVPRRALHDPEWERTYYMQVMWLSVCRIFWL
jgi:hypothetical protein